jgi:hypothetical protein
MPCQEMKQHSFARECQPAIKIETKKRGKKTRINEKAKTAG